MALRGVRAAQCHDERVDWLSSPSSARAAVAVSASMLESTGTRSMELCDRSMLATKATVAQLACRTKYVHRPGRMKACVTTRTSPFPTARLHARHFARELGASPSEYVFGRVLKEEPMRTASASLAPGTAWYSLNGSGGSVHLPCHFPVMSLRFTPPANQCRSARGRR